MPTSMACAIHAVTRATTVLSGNVHVADREASQTELPGTRSMTYPMIVPSSFATHAAGYVQSVPLSAAHFPLMDQSCSISSSDLTSLYKWCVKGGSAQ